ncbi:MAG TPA: hypothetical protein VNB23_13710, partial [Ramlibacter sp.]|nr:hypothetical protein [Ramlibacter sp.]
VSDFSGFEQSFVLGSTGPVADTSRPSNLPVSRNRGRSYDVPLPEIEFRRVHAGDELAAVQKLRSEIQLPGAAMADPGFLAREKKETGMVWSVLSNGATISSER